MIIILTTVYTTYILIVISYFKFSKILTFNCIKNVSTITERISCQLIYHPTYRGYFLESLYLKTSLEIIFIRDIKCSKKYICAKDSLICIRIKIKKITIKIVKRIICNCKTKRNIWLYFFYSLLF